MDWTGGSRRRYAGKGKQNEVVQRQKAHFAKVRAAQHQQPAMPDHSSNALASKHYKSTIVSSHRSREPRSTGSKASKSSRRTNDYETASKGVTPRLGKSSRQTANMTDEERLLLANRERLLARSDWLGLGPSRPARMRFPSHSDRDRVGKRRKIHKSKSQSHRGKPARRRSISPLHEHRLPQFEPMMSGALTNEHIQVKIGTDAFVSQSQHSMPAQPSVNTSMRQPSTDFGPLSEESMLLDADDDGFEIDERGQYLGALGQMGSQCGWPQSNLQLTERSTGPTNSIAPTFATTNHGEDLYDDNPSGQPLSRLSPQPSVQGEHCFATNCHRHHLAQGRICDWEDVGQENLPPEKQERIQSDVADPEEDERQWRRAMRIPDSNSTRKSSIVALRSSSPHITQSTTSTWPARVEIAAIDAQVQRRYDDSKNIYHAKSGGPQNALLMVGETHDAQSNTERGIQSNPVSQQAGDRQVGDDEALWRNFILGKRGSDSDDSSGLEHGVWTREQEQPVQRAFQSTSSGVGTDTARSDKVTVGDSVLVPEQESDDSEELDYANSDDHGRNRNQTTTSMVGHANTASFEDDEIDEVYPDDSVSRATGNNHVSRTASLLNPKRFRRQRTNEAPLNAENPHRFKVRTTERTVW